jgi:NAD-dependent dihydropyrimidine dehydrogenase PreA subunit/nitroreductase
MISVFEVDQQKCIKCKACKDVCPENVFAFTNNKISINPENNCFSCGHCMLVCPSEAIKSLTTSSFFTVNDKFPNIPIDQLIFHKKRSIRSFSDRSIEKNTIDKLIEYSEKAPSAHNFRNRMYHVITNQTQIDYLKKIIIKSNKQFLNIMNNFTLFIISLFSKAAYQEFSSLRKSISQVIKNYNNNIDSIFYGSKCIFLISAPSRIPFSRDDCIASQHYMMLYGETQNIGSFIVGLAQSSHKPIEKYFKIRKGYSIYAISAFGYGNHKYINDIVFKQPSVYYLN